MNSPESMRPMVPTRPEREACCGSGCSPCIFDLYEAQLEHYRAALTQWEVRLGRSTDPSG